MYDVRRVPSGVRDVLRVKLTATAHAELDEACAWIANDSPQHAATFRRGVQAAVASLTTFPRRLPLAAESASFGREIRQLVQGSYRLLFEIDGNVVRVLHVRHGARRRLGEEE
jgi:plasmid stabilization system protein ParE